MDEHVLSPGDRFTTLVTVLRGESGVTSGEDEPRSAKRFGASALKVDGKIFAMLTKDRLVVKLPRDRVDALIASGDGERFDPGHGRVMNEWLRLHPASSVEWEVVAREAMGFVGAKR